MKIIFITITLLSLMLTGCVEKKITEKEFDLLFKEYLKSEFEESFDENQSTFQRQQILKKVISNYGYDILRFKQYMKENHPDYYKNIYGE